MTLAITTAFIIYISRLVEERKEALKHNQSSVKIKAPNDLSGDDSKNCFQMKAIQIPQNVKAKASIEDDLVLEDIEEMSAEQIIPYLEQDNPNYNNDRYAQNDPKPSGSQIERIL